MSKEKYYSYPVLRTGIGFSADPDSAFYLSSDPGPDSESPTNADPNADPSQTLPSQKVEF
jgi:hypothetical protein